MTYLHHAMKRAFVSQLGSQTEASRRHFVGSIEEVDSGPELRFRSTEDFWGFWQSALTTQRNLNVPAMGPSWNELREERLS